MKTHSPFGRLVPLLIISLAPLAAALALAAQLATEPAPINDSEVGPTAATEDLPPPPGARANPLRPARAAGETPDTVTPTAGPGPGAQGPNAQGPVKATKVPISTSTALAGEKPETDPIKVNGVYFDGWPKPDLALFISGRMDGYLEPCGCAGLENQKGGVSRRHTLLKQLREQNWNVLPVDVGSLVHRFGRQAELKFAVAADALKTMGYKAVGLGPDDLRLSAGELAAAAADADVFVSANVDLLGILPRVRIIEQAGRKIGITSVLGDSYQQTVNNPEIQFSPAAEALRQVIGQLDHCDLRILLANATTAESKALAKAFPQFEVVVTSDGGDEPEHRPRTIEGTKTRLIEVGHKGMYAVVLGFYDDRSQPSRYQRVALDSRYKGTEEMKQLMRNYQSQLEALGWEGLLGTRLTAHPRGADHDKSWGEFVGSKSCKECHPTAYKIWAGTKHAQATEGLAKLDPPRQFDAECVSCHATGWNAQEFSPYATGFVSLKATPQLAGNGCENCHGPGAAHVAAEHGKSNTARQELRDAMKLRVGEAKDDLCIRCHDGDNDPNFSKTDFQVYWSKIKHEGKR